MLPVSANFLNLWKSRYAAVQLRVLHLKEIWLYLTGLATATSSSNTVGNPPENTIDGDLGTYLEVENVSSSSNGRYDATDFPENNIFTTEGGNDYYLLPAHDGDQTSPWQVEYTWGDECTTDQIAAYVKTDASPYGIITWDATGYYICQPSDAGGSGYAHLKKITAIPVSQTPRTIAFENEWELRNGTTATMRFTSGWSITSVKDTAYGDIYISMHGGGKIELFHRPNRSTSLTSILLGTHALAVGHKVRTRMLAKNGRYKIWLWVDTGAGWVVKVDGYEIVLYDFVNLYPEVGSFSPSSATPPQRWLDYFTTGYLQTQAEISGGDTLEAIVGLTSIQADNRFMGWALRKDDLPAWDMRNGVSAKFLIKSQTNRTNFVVRLVDNYGADNLGVELTFDNRAITGSAYEFYSQAAGHEIEIFGRMNAARTTFFGIIRNTNLDTSVTLEQNITLATTEVWQQPITFPNGGVGFGCAYYTGESIYNSDFYKVLLKYFEISTTHEWLKIDLHSPQFIADIKITFDHADTTPDILYCVFNGDYESVTTIITPSLSQIIPVGRIINEMFFYWGLSVNPVKINEVEIQPSEEIDAKDFSIFRRKDYRLDQTLIGEATFSTSDEFDRFDPNDKIIIQAGFNYEYVTIWTGFIDKIQDALERQHLSIKMRDAMKPFARKKIAPNEIVAQKVKDILNAISDECGIDVSIRDFDDPSIFLDYWAPKDVRAIDDVKKLIGATIDSEFYADEEGRIIFRSFLPVTKISELWDTDSDFDNKKSAISNFIIGDDKITTNPTPVSLITTIDRVYGPIEMGYNFFAFGVKYGSLIIEFSFLVIEFTTEKDIVGLAVKFKSIPFKYYTQEEQERLLTPKIRIRIIVSYMGGQQEWYFEVEPTFVVDIPSLQFFTQTLFLSPIPQPIDEIVVHSFVEWEFITPPSPVWAYQGDYLQHHFYEITNVSGGVVLDAFIRAINQDYYEVNIVKDIFTNIGTFCNWESSSIASSPTALDLFEVIDDGYALFNYYIRYSADGISFSPKIYIQKNTILTGIALTNYYRIGVDATAITSQYIDLIRLYWWVGGGGDRFARPVVLELTGDEIKDAYRLKMDEVGGGNALINSVEVKAQPKYVAGADDDVWQGTVNGEPISALNPLVVSAVPLEFLIDLKEPIKESSQALQITWSVGGVGVTFTAHATKPTLSINDTGTITDLRITGRRIITDANIAARADDPASIATYGEAKETIDNDYISKIEIAAAKADLLIDRFAEPMTIVDMSIIFTPQIQHGDIVRVVYPEKDLNDRAYVLEIKHEMMAQKNGYNLGTKIKVLLLPA